MDPLTIGFEKAFHEANLASDSPDVAIHLAAALRAVIEASPHRTRAVVTITATEGGRIELSKDGDTYVLERDAGRWRLSGSREAAWSGPVAAALTEWLIS